MRDLVRAREAASEDLRKKRQQLQSFLLRHGRIFTGRRSGSAAHLRWLAAQKFEHPAQQIVFQDLVDAERAANERLAAFERHIEELLPEWSMAPFVAAYQALRGVSLIVGVSVSSVQRIWPAHGLQPHRMRQFKLSNDPEFVAKLRDIVGLYVSPPAHAVVLSLDEKSQIQALDRTQPGLPIK